MSLFDALLLDPAPYHIWISIRSDKQLGSGVITDPFDGSKLVATYRFDQVMAKFASISNVVVHLGPGMFPTQGYGGTSAAWQAQPGMKILGSGIELTTLKLDITAPENEKHYFAVGHDLTTKVDSFEISDLTIDMNLASFVAGSITSAAGGVRVMGNHARIRRVNAINYGTRSIGMVKKTCYVLSLVTGAPDSGNSSLQEMVDVGIEECYVTTPGASVADSLVTLLNVGSQDDLNTTNETQAKSPFIRNCFVDGGVTTPRPAPTLGGPAYVRAISMAWCRGGVVEGNQIYGVDVGGPYAGGITYQTQLSIRDLIVRNNYYKNVARGPWLDLFFQGANLVSGGTAPTLTITGLVGVVSGANLGLATVLSGDRIWLQAGGSHDGMYQVRDVVVGTTSSFTITTVASTPTPVNVTTVKKLKSVTRAIFEGNVIELDVSTAAGPPTSMGFEVGDGLAAIGPDFGAGDILLRNNKVLYLDGASGNPTPFTGKGTLIAGAKTLQVASNVVFSDQPNPLQNARCGFVMYFNNRTPKTKLIQGLNAVTSTKYGELETDVDDMFVLSFMQD